ncbi:XRE family transcriptional regulator [Paenibacillus albus]|uniref:XRE family transcriptional regulator n=1 Tax=Paenibacillus albus TaxID=2495582 RepID=A0A3Q8X9Z9_9BACL|nr:XRE family transcriptional regulator [Paenibacillus albus]
MGFRVRDLRKERGLSQEKFGEISGFHNTYVGAIERGKQNITLLNLEKLAESLEVEVLELFRYTDIDLGKTNKQRDLQEIVDLLTGLSDSDIIKAKVILREIFDKQHPDL